jgi:hypothetical protein
MGLSYAAAAMRAPTSRLQVVAVMAIAGLGLHEARYLLEPGGDLAGHLGHDHRYLGLVAPALAALALVALALFVRRLALAAGRAGPQPRSVSLLGVWLVASGGLLAVYLGQESVESLVVSGHGGGLHALFGHGGLIVVLLAHLVGLLVALAVRGGRALIEAFARRRASVARRPGGVARPRLTEILASLSVAARHLAPRGPPSSLVVH